MKGLIILWMVGFIIKIINAGLPPKKVFYYNYPVHLQSDDFLNQFLKLPVPKQDLQDLVAARQGLQKLLDELGKLYSRFQNWKQLQEVGIEVANRLAFLEKALSSYNNIVIGSHNAVIGDANIVIGSDQVLVGNDNWVLRREPLTITEASDVLVIGNFIIYLAKVEQIGQNPDIAVDIIDMKKHRIDIGKLEEKVPKRPCGCEKKDSVLLRPKPSGPQVAPAIKEVRDPYIIRKKIMKKDRWVFQAKK